MVLRCFQSSGVLADFFSSDWCPARNECVILVGLSCVILNQFTLAKYLPLYTSAVNSQGKYFSAYLSSSRLSNRYWYEQDLMNDRAGNMDWEVNKRSLPPTNDPQNLAVMAPIIGILPYPACWNLKSCEHFGDVESVIPTQCIVSAVYCSTWLLWLTSSSTRG